MKKILLGLAAIATVIVLSSAIYAAGKDATGEEIKLYLGETKVLSVNSPSRIVIGNPSVVDVAEVGDDFITLNPKSLGTTTFVFWDNFGEQSYRLRVLAEDVQDIKSRIDRLLKELNLPDVYTKAAETEGKVLLLGEVRTAEDSSRIELALGPLKEKVTNLIKVQEQAIVDIDVQVLELSNDATKTLGFTMPTSISASETPGRFPKALGSSMDAIFHVFNWPRSSFSATVNLLVQEGKARILSQPRLACLSGKEAELMVGGEKPIFTTSVDVTAGASTDVEYKEYGIKLKFKPTVVDNKKIHLALNVDVSELQSAEFIGLESDRTAQAYPLTRRNVSTELYLDDGQTMAIGGLIKRKNEEDVNRTAFLSDIPILGALFRKRTTKGGGGAGERGDVELFITLTPTIVAGKAAPADSVVSPAGSGRAVESRPVALDDDISPELKDYIRTVQLKIINAVYYPQEAKDLGWEGNVNLILRLASNGSLKDARIAQSSGYKLLDDTTLDVVRQQSPYPPFPSQVELQELKIQVPVIYRRQ
jgi:pilus assembly protein CpaC